MPDIQTLAKPVKIKFCGITQLEDALYAEHLGVDALGFVFFHKSPRNISVSTAKSIIDRLSPFTIKVGLFVDESKETIQKIINTINIDVLQFHGSESAEFCEQFNKTYIKAIAVKDDFDMSYWEQAYPKASGFLCDTYHPEKKGGTGESFDWDLLPQKSDKPIILAGGLTANNVSQAIAAVKPYAVDVSSGIEKSPGIKDKNKMQAFVKEMLIKN